VFAFGTFVNVVLGDAIAIATVTATDAAHAAAIPSFHFLLMYLPLICGVNGRLDARGGRRARG
jgi:hypothetical protein